MKALVLIGSGLLIASILSIASTKALPITKDCHTLVNWILKLFLKETGTGGTGWFNRTKFVTQPVKPGAWRQIKGGQAGQASLSARPSGCTGVNEHSQTYLVAFAASAPPEATFSKLQFWWGHPAT